MSDTQEFFQIPQLQGINEETDSNASISFPDQAPLRKSLTRMVVIDELPFKVVEGKGFVEFINNICPWFKIPSRWTVARDCFEIYMDERLLLKNCLKENVQRISISTSTWTSIQQTNYICITAHFIDKEWRLHKKILNFCPIFSHKGEAIGRTIEACLLDWGIDKVFTITVDNASLNDDVVEYLKNKFVSCGTAIACGKYLHIRCIAHIINLIVRDSFEEIDLSIKWVREAVKYIRQSPSRLKKFKECAESLQIQCNSTLCLDVNMRWNSTYLMLRVAEKYKRAFEMFELSDPYFRLEVDASVKGFVDWGNVRETTAILERFHCTVSHISRSLYVTSNIWWTEFSDHLAVILQRTSSDDANVREIGTKMKAKFDKYWGNIDKMNKLIFFAAALDPREKFEVIQFAFCEIYGEIEGNILYESIKEAFYVLFNEYKNKLKSQSGHSSETSPSNISRVLESASSRWRRYRLNAAKKQLESGKSELDLYLSEKVQDDRADFDILKWWKLNSEIFPVLAHMACDILAVPMSAVTSESAFSASATVLDPFRSSLTPKVVESLVCAQDWLRKTHRINVEEDITEVENFENDLPITEFGGLAVSGGT